MPLDITSRKSALVLGAAHYFTGKQCERGHIAERYSHNGECIARANNLLVGRAAYETARRLYPQDIIQYRCGTRVIERNDREEG